MTAARVLEAGGVTTDGDLSAASPGFLLTDLYQLNMMQAYLDSGQTDTAVFEFFVRKLPPGRNFLIAAGIEPVVAFLQAATFDDAAIAWLRDSGRFSGEFVDTLAGLRFTGDVDAVPEGTAVFANEPILRVRAPLPMAQLVETRLINLMQISCLVASKAARMVLAAPDGANLVDFGLRRAHGGEAGLLAARAAYLAGFAATATVPAARLWDVPLMGTMAHAFVEAHADELSAFRNFARSRPDETVLLIDTYDTREGARNVVRLAPELAAEGIAIKGVRIDSGDLDADARAVRHILDAGGLTDTAIVVSGGLDEWKLDALRRAGAPISGFGIGTALTTSEDAPALDCAYKLQEYAGRLCRKLSSGKATWPGRKQVWRSYGADGRMAGDVLGGADESHDGEPLLRPVLRAGERVDAAPDVSAIRAHTGRQLAALPQSLRTLDDADPPYPVTVSAALRRTADELAAEIAARNRAAAARTG
jgi:nicotinate phosphoribosyltransferase